MQTNRMGISLQRKFKYQKAHQSYDERLIDYYFWALENLNTKGSSDTHIAVLKNTTR